MIQIILSIRDKVADVYGRPVFVPTSGAGVRSFTDEVNRASPDNSMNQHPGDYDLYKLGVYDDNTGIISMLPQPELVAKGDQVKL